MFILKQGHQPGVYVPLRAGVQFGGDSAKNRAQSQLVSPCLAVKEKSISPCFFGNFQKLLSILTADIRLLGCLQRYKATA